MARFQIQRADRNGEFDDIHKASFSELGQAKQYANEWSRKDPTCAWGVRVMDTMDKSVVWED